MIQCVRKQGLGVNVDRKYACKMKRAMSGKRMRVRGSEFRTRLSTFSQSMSDQMHPNILARAILHPRALFSYPFLSHLTLVPVPVPSWYPLGMTRSGRMYLLEAPPISE